MNSNVLTQTIVTGSDPRGLPEFSAIREEINKASHPSQPELNWKLVESLALAIFKANGVDLHLSLIHILTEEAGLVQLAQQQYRMLFRMGLQMMVADWEPSLLEQLEQKFTAEQ